MSEIAIATGTRADWGLLRPLAVCLRDMGIEPRILATHAHLLPEFGNTLREIEGDGFEPAAKIPAYGTPAEATAMALRGFAEYFAGCKTDCVVILGDRFEMMGVATAAMLSGVKIAHIAGGTVSEGAFDDTIRDCISRMATLHFPETEACAARLVSKGADPERVTVSGALGLTGLADNRPEESDREFMPEGDYLLMTLHAETRPDDADYDFERATRNLLAALSSLLPETGLVITYPNADVDASGAIRAIEEFGAAHPERVRVVPSLGHRRYLVVAERSRGVVGNSSSGLVEIPSLGVPTLDVGGRQRGREHGPSVINVADYEIEGIERGLAELLSPRMRQIAAKRENPYYREGTARLIARGIVEG